MTEPTPDELREAILNPLTVTEVERCRTAARALSGQAWAMRLLGLIGPDTEWTRARAGFLLELRLAAELASRGIAACYERGGEGAKSIDFVFEHSGLTWMVEVVGPRAIQAATSALVHNPDVGVWSMSLSSTNEDQRQTHGGELIRLQGLLTTKASKFPPPEAGRVHVIFADTRLIGITGVDAYDARQLAYGPRGIPGPLVNYYRDQPVRGMFEPEAPLRDGQKLRERIHFVVLSEDDVYGPDTLLTNTLILPNPSVGTDAAMRTALDAWVSGREP